MTTVTNTYRVTLNVPQDKAFAYVSDLTRHPEWSGGKLIIEPVKPGPLAVGSQYRSRGDIPGQKDRPNELRVTEYQPNSRFTFLANDPSFGDVAHTFTFAAQGNRTVMERIVTVNMPGFQAFIFKLIIHRFIGKPMMEKSLAALQAKLEQR